MANVDHKGNDVGAPTKPLNKLAAHGHNHQGDDHQEGRRVETRRPLHPTFKADTSKNKLA